LNSFAHVNEAIAGEVNACPNDHSVCMAVGLDDVGLDLHSGRSADIANRGLIASDKFEILIMVPIRPF